jgi:hypothetical protein
MDLIDSTCVIALLLRMKSKKKTQTKTLGAPTYKSNSLSYRAGRFSNSKINFTVSKTMCDGELSTADSLSDIIQYQ